MYSQLSILNYPRVEDYADYFASNATGTMPGVFDAASAGTPAAAWVLPVIAEVVLQPHDCVAFDHFAAHTSHTGWNASDEPTVLWKARLLKIDEPFTTFINSEGTPVS